MNIFNNPQKNKYTLNGFIIVTTFGNAPRSFPNGNPIPAASTIANALVLGSKYTIVFSPIGNIYINGECIFYNPVTDSDKQETFNVNWEVIDIQKYSKFNNQAPIPNYFLSNGKGGWLLFNDTATSGNVYLLYNTINRPEFTWNANAYGNYCKTIQFQDPGCYCNNYPNQKPRCSYAYLTSEDNGVSIFSQLPTTPENAQAFETINNQCGCNSICKTWTQSGGSNLPASMNQVPTCNSIQNLTFCGVGMSASTEGKINAAGFTVTQNCGTNSSMNTSTITPTITQPSYTQPSYTQPSYTQPSYTQPSYTQPSYTQPGDDPSYTQPGDGPVYTQPGDGPVYTQPQPGVLSKPSSKTSKTIFIVGGVIFLLVIIFIFIILNGHK